ncbi:MAG: PQQ-dependent sugar dehydrogenase [Gemmataceae bacterium]
MDRPAGQELRGAAGQPVLETQGRLGLWAFGFRNPWRMTFDPATGDLLVGDVGQDLWEMIRLVTKGSNHGWSVTEGSAPFHPNRKAGPGPIVPPLIEHPHSESRSITGGVVYQGKRLPELRGVYVYGDYSTGKVWGLRHKGGKAVWKKDLANEVADQVGIGTDRDGELYLVDHGGQVHCSEPSPPGKGHRRSPGRWVKADYSSPCHRLQSRPSSRTSVNSPSCGPTGPTRSGRCRCPAWIRSASPGGRPVAVPREDGAEDLLRSTSPAARRRVETRFLDAPAGRVAATATAGTTTSTTPALWRKEARPPCSDSATGRRWRRDHARRVHGLPPGRRATSSA